jgi:hypothetical protein
MASQMKQRHRAGSICCYQTTGNQPGITRQPVQQPAPVKSMDVACAASTSHRICCRPPTVTTRQYLPDSIDLTSTLLPGSMEAPAAPSMEKTANCAHVQIDNYGLADKVVDGTQLCSVARPCAGACQLDIGAAAGKAGTWPLLISAAADLPAR